MSHLLKQEATDIPVPHTVHGNRTISGMSPRPFDCTHTHTHTHFRLRETTWGWLAVRTYLPRGGSLRKHSAKTNRSGRGREPVLCRGSGILFQFEIQDSRLLTRRFIAMLPWVAKHQGTWPGLEIWFGPTWGCFVPFLLLPSRRMRGGGSVSVPGRSVPVLGPMG